MCSICQEFDAAYMVSHSRDMCPFAACLYCTVCAAYGHTAECCGKRPAAHYTAPCFVEQFVPSTARPATQTPLGTQEQTEAVVAQCVQDALKNEEVTSQGVIRIKKEDKVIRAYLMARSLLGTRIKTKNCKDMLDKYAKEQGKRVTCFPDTW